MSQIMLELPQDVRERVEVRSNAANQRPEIFLLRVIEEYLEDMEDLEDAVRISEAVTCGEEEVYTAEEVRRDLGLDS